MTDRKQARAQKNYHHGNLQQSLVQEATWMISEVGVEGLSMRSLAERVGVSRTAAYHHFRDKNALLCAIAEQGFQHWRLHFARLLEQKPVDIEQWLIAFTRSYLDFAQQHQEEYDLMFGRPVWKNGQPTESLKSESSACFQSYVEFIRTWQRLGVFSEKVDCLRLAQVSWSTLHGMSRLINDGIYLDRESVDSMSLNAVKMMIAGVKKS